MVKRLIVEQVIKQEGFYAPHIVTNQPTFAAIPEELLDKVEVGDEVTVYSDSHLNYGGIGAIVIETPKAKLNTIK